MLFHCAFSKKKTQEKICIFGSKLYINAKLAKEINLVNYMYLEMTFIKRHRRIFIKFTKKEQKNIFFITKSYYFDDKTNRVEDYYCVNINSFLEDNSLACGSPKYFPVTRLGKKVICFDFA
jgi:hypothetical protein